MRYLSVCSGIEAATAAWHPLGWQPFAFSEIEPFPSAVLAHHYPDVPNLGDMTKFKEWPDADIDVLVGGTPCQSFSVAGLRKGLDDPRGNLMLTYLAIADRYRPRWLVWENVPGVLSSNKGKDFGTFLGGLAELGYGFAYRILDAQYFGVAQRRRRVFVIGYLGDWRRAAAVLFERHSLQGHPAPRREKGERPSPCLDVRAGRSGETTFHTSGGLIETLCISTGQAGAEIGADIATTLNCNHEAPYIAHSLRGEGFDASEDGTGRGTPLIPIQSIQSVRQRKQNGMGIGDDGDPMYTMTGRDRHAIAFDTTQITSKANYSNPQPGDPCHPSALRASGGGGDKAHVLTSMQVRRLTPRECERLQGFPDDFTKIPLRNSKGVLNGKWAKDSPRYKALGNSMAVPCMAWIGERIQMVEQLDVKEAA